MIEHGSTRSSRWLHDRRTRLALWIAIAEGILVAVDVIPWLVAILVAALVLVGYFAWARWQRSQTVRETSWVLAVSQACVALVPVLVIVVGALALIAVAALAVIALVLLFSDRA